jgi:hypothetical protein
MKKPGRVKKIEDILHLTLSEKNDPTSLCVERQNKHRVRVDRLRGSPTSHLLSHLATSDNGRFSG